MTAMLTTSKSSQKFTTRTINVRVPHDLYLQLEELALTTDRTKSFITVAALSSYLESQSWQIKDIQDGIAEANKDDFASEKQVNAVFAKYGA